jgi:hypothetical protein
MLQKQIEELESDKDEYLFAITAGEGRASRGITQDA